jgi:hypothetical protein
MEWGEGKNHDKHAQPTATEGEGKKRREKKTAERERKKTRKGGASHEGNTRGKSACAPPMQPWRTRRTKEEEEVASERREGWRFGRKV